MSKTKSLPLSINSDGEIPSLSFRTAYSPKPRHITVIEGDSMTKQSFKDECDINTIMGRYLKTGILDFTNQYEPQYGDVSNIDFAACMEQVLQAQTMFDALPATLRERFANNPQQFIDYIGNPANVPEMRSLGLLKPRQDAEATPKVSPQPEATK